MHSKESKSISFEDYYNKYNELEVNESTSGDTPTLSDQDLCVEEEVIILEGLTLLSSSYCDGAFVVVRVKS